jgi:hypothetical protein
VRRRDQPPRWARLPHHRRTPRRRAARSPIGRARGLRAGRRRARKLDRRTQARRHIFSHDGATRANGRGAGLLRRRRPLIREPQTHGRGNPRDHALPRLPGGRAELAAGASSLSLVQTGRLMNHARCCELTMICTAGALDRVHYSFAAGAVISRVLTRGCSIGVRRSHPPSLTALSPAT